MKTLQERLALFFQALKEAEPASSADDALKLVESVLDAVEDTHSGVPKADNPPLEYQGRMYAPRQDFVFRRADGGISAYSKGHLLELGANGSIAVYLRNSEGREIGSLPTDLVFSKDGAKAQEAP